ncbi:MAG: serine hydrolase [Chitinophagaceae bacterium]|nr:MAG: serine hydrolase [Chitinophagaceae bacterium]
MRLILYLLLLPLSTLQAQTASRPDKKLNKALADIVRTVGLDSNFNVGDTFPEQVSIALIDYTRQPVFAGFHADNFIYPASIYKMYVAMEILKQVNEGNHSLQQLYIVPSKNAVDKSREVASDPRPLLQAGDSVTINYLLDLMITRSDNSAANCLIDIADRKNINATMHANGWKGSEVTRKFLSRKLEDPGYDGIRGTETNARHAADFLYKLASNQLINPWVSMQLKALLARQLDKTKLASGLPGDAMFSHKTGWWSFYTHDVGIVEDGRVKYVLAVFTPVNEREMNGRLTQLAEKVHSLLLSRHNK